LRKAWIDLTRSLHDRSPRGFSPWSYQILRLCGSGLKVLLITDHHLQETPSSRTMPSPPTPSLVSRAGASRGIWVITKPYFGLAAPWSSLQNSRITCGWRHQSILMRELWYCNKALPEALSQDIDRKMGLKLVSCMKRNKKLGFRAGGLLGRPHRAGCVS